MNLSYTDQVSDHKFARIFIAVLFASAKKQWQSKCLLMWQLWNQILYAENILCNLALWKEWSEL